MGRVQHGETEAWMDLPVWGEWVASVSSLEGCWNGDGVLGAVLATLVPFGAVCDCGWGGTGSVVQGDIAQL